jgi:hypothetical protein
MCAHVGNLAGIDRQVGGKKVGGHTGARSYVVDEEAARSAAIVGTGDGAE